MQAGPAMAIIWAEGSSVPGTTAGEAALGPADSKGTGTGDALPPTFQVSCWSWISLFQLHKLFNELLTLLVALWLKVQATMSNFYMGSGHPNSGPSICTSKTLPSEPPSFGPVGSFQSGIKEAWGHVSTIFYPYYCLCSAHILSHMLNHL